MDYLILIGGCIVYFWWNFKHIERWENRDRYHEQRRKHLKNRPWVFKWMSNFINKVALKRKQ